MSLQTSGTLLQRHLPWIDWVRFVAAALVFASHARSMAFVEFGQLPPNQRNLITAAIFALTRLGNEAVIIFFVLSGFLVAGKTTERIANQRFKLFDYTVDRFTRIYTPYLPTLLVTAAIGLLSGVRVSIFDLLVNAAALQGVFGQTFGGNAPLWSIAYEVWFYILIGSVGGFERSRNYRLKGVAGHFIFFFLTLCVFSVLSSVYLFCWVIGGLGYFVKRRSPGMLFFGVIVAVVSVIGLQMTFDSRSVTSAAWTRYIPSTSVLQLSTAMGAAMFVTQVVKFHPERRSLRIADVVGTRLATFSYSLYLIHYPVLLAAGRYIPKARSISVHSVGNFVLLCFIGLGSGLVMYGLFERNTGNVRRWMHSMRRPVTAD